MAKSTSTWLLKQFAILLALTIVHTAALPLGAFLANALPESSSNPEGVNSEEVATTHRDEGLTQSQTPAIQSNGPSSDAQRMLLTAILVAGLNSLVIVLVLNCLRGSWSKVFATLWVAFFACMTFFPQSEVLFFLKNPWPILRLTFLMGVTIATLVCGIAAIFRSRLQKQESSEPNKPAWIQWRTLILVPLYVFLYLMFGYFVAWQFESVREFYSGSSDLLDFWSHMTSNQVTQRVLPLQLVRGVLWAFLMVFLARQLTGNTTTIGIYVGLAVAVWMNSQLLLPNPYMPTDVRMIHMLETATCNFIYGVLAMQVLLAGSGNRDNFTSSAN